MNEVRLSPVTSAAARPASSKGGELDSPVQPVGKVLPPAAAEKQEPPVEAKVHAGSPDKVQDAVVSMNQFVQSVNRDLHFSVDEETDRMVIKVIDGASGEVIRQIPEEVFLELARKLNDDGEFQLIDALG